MSGAWYEICTNLQCVPSNNQPDSIWILDRTGSERMSKLDQHASLNLFYSNQKTGHKPLPLSAALHLFWFLGETGTNGILYLHMLAKPIFNLQYIPRNMHTVFALLCFVVVIHWLIFPISIRLTSLALWQSNDCPSASKAILMNMDTYFMWIHHERLHNHNKAKHNKTVCIFLGTYCMNNRPNI